MLLTSNGEHASRITRYRNWRDRYESIPINDRFYLMFGRFYLLRASYKLYLRIWWPFVQDCIYLILSKRKWIQWPMTIDSPVRLLETLCAKTARSSSFLWHNYRIVIHFARFTFTLQFKLLYDYYVSQTRNWLILKNKEWIRLLIRIFDTSNFSETVRI